MSSSPTCTCMSSPPLPVATACGSYPSSITDAQWMILARLLPAPGNTRGKGGRPEKHDRRRVLDALFYLVRGGLAWRQLPAEFPPWQTVYTVFTRWPTAGTWQAIHDAPAQPNHEPSSQTTSHVHHHPPVPARGHAYAERHQPATAHPAGSVRARLAAPLPNGPRADARTAHAGFPRRRRSPHLPRAALP